MNSGIYIIHNTKNGKVYIGQAQNIPKRWAVHKYTLNAGTHSNSHLQAAWNKYGAKSFRFKVLEYCPKEQMTEREQHYLNVYMAKGICYNVMNKVTTPNYGGRNGTIDKGIYSLEQLGIDRVLTVFREQSSFRKAAETLNVHVFSLSLYLTRNHIKHSIEQGTQS